MMLNILLSITGLACAVVLFPDDKDDFNFISNTRAMIAFFIAIANIIALIAVDHLEPRLWLLGSSLATLLLRIRLNHIKSLLQFFNRSL